MSHSPEPWASCGSCCKYDDSEYRHAMFSTAVIRGGDNDFAVDVFASPGARGQADIRRIVACVNACAGIPTEVIESGHVKDWMWNLEIGPEYVAGVAGSLAELIELTSGNRDILFGKPPGRDSDAPSPPDP